MKTFDIALEHLKDIDFRKYNVYNDKDVLDDNESLRKQITERKIYFDSDKRNTLSNDYYRSMVYESCIYHLIDLAHNRYSYWLVACDIVDAYKYILKDKFEVYGNTTYPNVMVDGFIKYCNSLNPQPTFLNDKSEVRIEFFMNAFHYVIDE